MLENQNLVSVEDLAKTLNVPVSWIYSRTRTGQIPFYRIGKYCRFDVDEVMAFIKKESEKALMA